MPISATPVRDRNETNVGQVVMAVLLPVSPSVRMAIESLLKETDGVVERRPFFRSEDRRQAYPSGCAPQFRLDVGLLGIALLYFVALY